jgi:FkbM family methyltransferase
MRWLRRSYVVGRYRIELPPGHMLDEHQQAFLNYDRKLPVVATLVEAKYPHSVTLDIGANIGDSAAAIRSVVAGPILCVEGNAAFLPYLHANLLRLPGTNRVIPKFIRPLETGADSFEIRTARGTAHLLQNNASVANGGGPQSTTVREILRNNADLGQVKLIKTDTDGFDFAILLGALDILSENLPVLYFEFDPIIGSSSPNAAIKAVEGLIDIGYRKVAIYDNYGNYLMGTTLSAELVLDLVASLTQCNQAGGGTKYFDLCCFSASDNDIFAALVDRERNGNLAQ